LYDLGTLITHLRLRAEFVEDTELKKMLTNLDDMEKMDLLRLPERVLWRRLQPERSSETSACLIIASP
jgi:hypothetical protein